MVVIVPIFWGSAWQRGNGPIASDDVLADIQAVAGAWYLAGLGDYGLAQTARVEPPIPVNVADAAIPNPLTGDQVWTFLDGLIAAGTVRPPTDWDQTKYRVYYGIAIAPGHANVDPNTFGENNKDYANIASAGYATANSNRAGVVQTFWHEVVEGAAAAEIVNDCRAQTFQVAGVTVSRYLVRGGCWPSVDLALELDPEGQVRVKGPFTAEIPVWNGLCGTQELSYHVDDQSYRLTARASAQGFNPADFAWFVNDVPVPRTVPATILIPALRSDPRPPAKTSSGLASITVARADEQLVLTTDPQNGNYQVEVAVNVKAASIAQATNTALINGLRCPEIEQADQACRDWYQGKTLKLDRDWRHWIDPGDPLIAAIGAQVGGGDPELFLELASGARELEALGSGDAEELAGRVAKAVGVDVGMILRR